MDWFSRYVLSWELSNTLDSAFCLDAMHEALQQSKPDIFNSNQGVQFTANAFTGTLESDGIRVSMNDRGRAFDNIFIERLWRSVKYEDINIKDYETVPTLDAGLHIYFMVYNTERLLQSLDNRTQAKVYFSC